MTHPPTSRKVIPAGFEGRRAKIVAKRHADLEPTVKNCPKRSFSTADEDKGRAYTVAAQRSRQRKLEHAKKPEELE